MKKLVTMVSLLALLTCMPHQGNAAVAGEGDGGLIIDVITQQINVEDIATILEETVDQHIANVFGVGMVNDADNNPVALFHRDTTGPGADAATLIDQLLSDLTGDVFSIPGDTDSFLTSSSLRGTSSEVLYSQFIQEFVGSSTTSENTITVDVSPDAVVVGDLTGDPYLLTVLAGTVTVTDYSIVTTTNFFTNTQTDFLLLTDEYDALATRVLLAPGDSQNNPVPEPATMVLFATGLAGFAGNHFRRKRQA